MNVYRTSYYDVMAGIETFIRKTVQSPENAKY